MGKLRLSDITGVLKANKFEYHSSIVEWACERVIEIESGGVNEVMELMEACS